MKKLAIAGSAFSGGAIQIIDIALDDNLYDVIKFMMIIKIF